MGQRCSFTWPLNSDLTLCRSLCESPQHLPGLLSQWITLQVGTEDSSFIASCGRFFSHGALSSHPPTGSRLFPCPEGSAPPPAPLLHQKGLPVGSGLGWGGAPPPGLLTSICREVRHHLVPQVPAPLVQHTCWPCAHRDSRLSLSSTFAIAGCPGVPGDSTPHS